MLLLKRKMVWTIWCFDWFKIYAKRWRCNIFISMKAMLREGENIYNSHMHNVPKYIKLINIKILKKWEKGTEHQCTIHGPPMRGNFFHNLRSKNAKNHAISLLEMQGCPQSNIKKEIKSFCFKNFTKSNNELS